MSNSILEGDNSGGRQHLESTLCPEVSQLSKFGGVGLMTADVVLCCRLQYMQYAVCGYTALGDMQSMVSVEVTRYGVFCLQLAGLGVE